MDYAKVFHALSEHEVRYLVVGGVALNLLGVPRMTGGLDLFVPLEKENLSRLLAALQSLGCWPRVPSEAEALLDPKVRAEMKEEGYASFPFLNPDTPTMTVNVVLEPPLRFPDAEKKREMVACGRLPVPVLSAADMIRWKDKFRRQRDRSDIESLHNLLRVQGKEKGPRKVKKGWLFSIPEEQIARWLKVPVEGRLSWLDESSRFHMEMRDPEALARWKAFRGR